MYDFDDVPLTRSYFRRFSSQLSTRPMGDNNRKYSSSPGRICILDLETRPTIEEFREIAEQYKREYRQASLTY